MCEYQRRRIDLNGLADYLARVNFDMTQRPAEHPAML